MIVNNSVGFIPKVCNKSSIGYDRLDKVIGNHAKNITRPLIFRIKQSVMAELNNESVSQIFHSYYTISTPNIYGIDIYRKVVDIPADIYNIDVSNDIGKICTAYIKSPRGKITNMHISSAKIFGFGIGSFSLDLTCDYKYPRSSGEAYDNYIEEYKANISYYLHIVV